MRRVNKTVLIGLGGTGQKVLLKVKKTLLQNFGEVPPMIKLMAFDTTDAESLEEIEYVSSLSNTKVREKVTFNKSEFLKIGVQDVNELKQAPRVKEWLDANVSRKIVPSSDGARQFRPQGRFSFFYNYAKAGLDEQIKNILQHINDAALTKNDRYHVINNESHRESMHLIFSPAGGTGSGTFLDFANIIKANTPDVKLTAHILMPDFFRIYGATDKIFANSYGALKEMDIVMDLEGEDGQGGDIVKSPWLVNYDGSEKISFLMDAQGNQIETRMFDSVFLYDNVSSNKRTWRKDDMVELIGRVFYQLVSGPGKVIEDAFNNFSDWEFRSNEQTGRKRRNYQALGYAELYLDRSFLKKLKKLQIVHSLLNEYMESQFEGDLQEGFRTFIDSNRLREDAGQDMVIDQLLGRDQFGFNGDAILQSIEFSRGAGEKLRTVCGGLISKEKQRGEGLANTQAEALYKTALEAIHAQIDKYLDMKGGVHLSKRFVNHLMGSFRGMQEEMNNEAETHKSAADNMLKSLPDYEALVKEAEDSWVPINKSKKIEERCVEYIKQVKNLVFSQHEHTRKVAAALFYSRIISELQNLGANLDEVNKVFDNAEVYLVDNIHRMKNMDLAQYDFEIPLHERYRNTMIVNKNEVQLGSAIQSLNFAKLRDIRSVEGLITFFSPYIEQLATYKEMDGLSVDQVLRELYQVDKTEFENIIRFLDINSAVNCNYTTTFATGDTGMPRMHNMHYLFSVDNQNDTVVNEEFFKKHLSGMYRIQNVSNGDSDRICLIKIEGAFIANVIERLKNWKTDYDGKGAENFHIDMKFIDGPDLFRDNSAKDALLYFGIGSALGLIECESRSGYYVKVKGKKETLADKGAKSKTNRDLAYSYFKKSEELCNFVKSRFELEKAEDPKRTKDLLLNHFKTIWDKEIIKKMDSTLNEDERDHIINERKEVANYALIEGLTKPHEYEQLGFSSSELRDLGLEF